MALNTAEQIVQLRDQFFERLNNAPNKDDLFHPKDLERARTIDKWLNCFLDHCDMDVKASLQMLWDTCEWRKNFGANDINESTLNMDYIREGLCFPRNRDRDGKVVFIFKSKLHFKGLRESKELLRIFVYWVDRIQREENYDSLTVFFDLAETTLANMDLDYTKSIVNILKYYYPGSVHSIILFEQPWVFSAAIKIIKAIMPPKAVAAIKSVTLKNIRDYIAEENMLKSWGGNDDYSFVFESEKSTDSQPTTPTTTSRKVHFANQSPQSSVQMSDMSNSVNSDRSDDPFLGIMLRVNPTDAIFFAKSGNELVGTVELTNICNTLITYKVKTTSPEKFRVRPSTGILAPGANSSINVVLHQGQHIQAVNKDKFLVMAMELNSDSSPSQQDIADLWKVTQSNSAHVEQHRLKCTQPLASLMASDTEITKNGTVFTGTVLHDDRHSSQLSSTISQLVDTTHRLESQMKFNQTLQWITIVVFLLLSVAIVYILKMEIRNSGAEYCMRPDN